VFPGASAFTTIPGSVPLPLPRSFGCGGAIIFTRVLCPHAADGYFLISAGQSALHFFHADDRQIRTARSSGSNTVAYVVDRDAQGRPDLARAPGSASRIETKRAFCRGAPRSPQVSSRRMAGCPAWRWLWSCCCAGAGVGCATPGTRTSLPALSDVCSAERSARVARPSGSRTVRESAIKISFSTATRYPRTSISSAE
jgi:hypothetical protein